MKTILNKLFEHQYLNRSEAYTMLLNISEGRYSEAQVASLITVFLMRNISVEELTGFREALLELRLPINLSQYKAIDIVGTGGDGKNTFNISTLSCFVVAAAGYKVAKHGNYGSSSISGASNVLEHCGVVFSNQEAKLQESIEKSGIAFLHAPLFNPALKAVAGVRKSLGVRSFFNMLGPLVNPALPSYQLLGVYNLALFRLYTYMYQESKINFTVVHSLDGYDEVSLSADFKVSTQTSEKIYTPQSLGFRKATEQELYGGNSIAENAKLFLNVLDNKSLDAQKNCVLANSAFAIHTICPEKSIETCLHEAKVALESGAAKKSFEKFVSLNN